MIKIDIKVGDTILTGKWKNKKVVVKNIDTDEFGSPTVNGKSILKIRIPKFYQKESMSMKLKDLIKEKVTIKKDNNFSNYKYKLKDSVEFIHPETKKKAVGTVVGKERIIRQGNFSDEDVDETFINILSDGEAISVAEDKVLRRVK